MSIFKRLDKVISRSIDHTNAQPFTLYPMKHEPNGRPVADGDRNTIEGKGVFDYYEVDYGIELGVRKSYREANDLRAQQSGREPYLSIDRKYFPTIADEPRQGDIIVIPELTDSPRFEVVKAQRDGQSRMVLRMVHKERQQ